MQDKKAFERARGEFRRRTDDLSETVVEEQLTMLVEQVRSQPPAPLQLLGVTFATSAETSHTRASSTLSFSSGA